MEPAIASQLAPGGRKVLGCRSIAEPNLASACAKFVAAVALGTVLLGAYQYVQRGVPGVGAAAIAGLACGLSSLSALIVAGLWRGTPYAVASQLGGSLLQMVPPLVVVLLLQPRLPLVATAGLFGCMVVLFLYALLIETVLLVRLVRSPSSASGLAASGGSLHSPKMS